MPLLGNVPPAGLLHRYPAMRTDSVEQVREFFCHPYAASQPRALEGTTVFFAQANRVQLSRLGLDFLNFISGVEADLPPTNYYREDFCLKGHGEKSMPGASIAVSRDESAVIAPNVGIHARLESGFQCLILRVDPSALARKLESVLGCHVNRAIEFATRTTFRNPTAQSLRRSVLFLTHELDSSDSELPGLAMGEFEDYLLLLFLSANPNNYSDILQRPQAASGPRHVRMIEDYLEANWNKTVTIEEIAEITGVSVRSVFHAFRNSRGYSPMAFMKDLRLKKAREMLERPEADASVASVADQCRFISHGHFSRAYERRFGEYPSDTLRRSRGRG
jgi:AraC-like DNA-binding protein